MRSQHNYFVDCPKFIEVMSFPNIKLLAYTHTNTGTKRVPNLLGVWKVTYKKN